MNIPTLSEIDPLLAGPQDLPPRKKRPGSVKLYIEKPQRDTPREEKPHLPYPWRSKTKRSRRPAPPRDLNPIPRREIFTAEGKYRAAPWGMSAKNEMLKSQISWTVSTISYIDSEFETGMSISRALEDDFRPATQGCFRSRSTPALRLSSPAPLMDLRPYWSTKGFHKCTGVI